MIVAALIAMVFYLQFLNEPLFIDARRIGQVLDNLVSNAVKYSHDGGTISLRSERGVGTSIVFVLAGCLSTVEGTTLNALNVLPSWENAT